MIDIALNTLRTLAFVLTQPMMAVFLLILAVGLYIQNRKISIMQQMIIGEPLSSPFELTISQLVIGILAGIFISLALTFLGVIFSENSPIGILFLISFLFMTFETKYTGFAYSAAVLAFLSLTLDLVSGAFNGATVNLAGISINMSAVNIFKVDIVSLMTLVGVLYIADGLLIMLDGKTGSIPVFTNRGGKIIGGFALKRYWMVPLVVLLLINNSSLSASADLIATPNWWPIVKTSIPVDVLEKSLLTLMPFFGVFGFSTVTFSRGKSEKVIVTGLSYFTYGLILTVTAQFAGNNILSQIIMIIFSVAAYEIIIKIEEYFELIKEPKYISDDEGIMVLAVAPDSSAFKMGIKSGDKLVEINNQKIETEKDLFSGLEMKNFIWIKVKREKGNYEELNYNRLNTGKKFGIVFVPKIIPSDSVVVKLRNQKAEGLFNKFNKKK